MWPDPPEVLRKKQEKALRAEREKMAILDRPAYKAPTKRISTPTEHVAQAPAVAQVQAVAQAPSVGVAPASYHGAPAISASPAFPPRQQDPGMSSSNAVSGRAHPQQHDYTALHHAEGAPGGSNFFFGPKPVERQEWRPSPRPSFSFSERPFNQERSSIAPFSSFGSMPSASGSTFDSTWSRPNSFAFSDMPRRPTPAHPTSASNSATSPVMVGGVPLLAQARPQAHAPVPAPTAAPLAPPQNPLLAAAAAAQAEPSPTA